MKITEILVESQQIDEGPLGSAVGAVGRGVGKAVGGVAKAAGAVAGGVAGIPGAVKKGFQAGKKTVAGDEPEQPAAAPAADAAQPASGGAKKGGIGGAIDQFKQGWAQGRGQTSGAQTSRPAPAPAPAPAAAPAASGAEQPAAEPTTSAAPPPTGTEKPAAGAREPAAAGTAYAQAKAAVDKLDKRGKGNLLKLLQKEFPPKAAAPAPEPAPAASTGDNDKPGFLQSKIKGRRKPPAPSQAEIDAERERIMGPTSDSIIRTGKSLSEELAKKIQQKKRQMFESNIKQGKFSIFVK